MEKNKIKSWYAVQGIYLTKIPSKLANNFFTLRVWMPIEIMGSNGIEEDHLQTPVPINIMVHMLGQRLRLRMLEITS